MTVAARPLPQSARSAVAAEPRSSARPAAGAVEGPLARPGDAAHLVPRCVGALVLGGVVVGLLGACSDGPPGTVLDGPRVMALIADPPTVGIDQIATVSLVTAVDGVLSPAAAPRWRACPPWAVVADPVRDCAEGAIDLAVDAEGRAVFDAGALAAAWGVTPPPAPDAVCGEAVVDVIVVVEADLAGARLIATKQVEVGAAPPARRNPEITRVLIGGEPVEDGAVLSAGATLDLTVDVARDSLDLVCSDGATTPDKLEDVRVYLYAGGGATTDDNDLEITDVEGASVAETKALTLPDTPGTVPLWLVATDRGGGVSVVQRTLRVE